LASMMLKFQEIIYNFSNADDWFIPNTSDDKNKITIDTLYTILIQVLIF